jgi:aspartyl protease family protein
MSARLLLLAFALAASLPAVAQTLLMMGLSARDAQLMIDNRTVRTLRIGETTPEGVKLVDIRNGVAQLEANGRQVSMRLGDSTQAQTVLTADRQGHFVTTIRINGVPATGIVDTGATDISLSAADAQRMGINYLQGRRAVAHTANGQIMVYLVNLAHVQVGDIAFNNVQGSVRQDGSAPVLIGMSFLRHVEMRRSGNTLTLTRAHH